MPAKDINVRRETSRRWYRKKVAAHKDFEDRKFEEVKGNEHVFIEIANAIKSESFMGWVSPQRILEVCSKQMHNFQILNKKEVVRWVEIYGCLWRANEVGVFMGTAPFLREEHPYGYFKKRVPRNQNSAVRAEILILETMIKFINKGHDVECFDWSRVGCSSGNVDPRERWGFECPDCGEWNEIDDDPNYTDIVTCSQCGKDFEPEVIG